METQTSSVYLVILCDVTERTAKTVSYRSRLYLLLTPVMLVLVASDLRLPYPFLRLGAVST
jgi:hypothetical protein